MILITACSSLKIFNDNCRSTNKINVWGKVVAIMLVAIELLIGCNRSNCNK